MSDYWDFEESILVCLKNHFKTILEDMLFIPDTDSLVLPSLIELKECLAS